MTNQDKVEAALKRWKRPMTTGEVAPWARLSSTQTTQALQALVRKGRVRRVDDGAGRGNYATYQLIGDDT